MIEFKHVICPVDFSDASVRAFAHAAALSRWYDSALTVLHVVPTFEPFQVRGDLAGSVGVVTPLPRAQVVADLRRALDLPSVAPQAQVVAEDGDPRTTIVNEALSRQADLIVMGTHGHRGVRRILLGSVAESVLREAPCPVMTVPPQAPAAAGETVAFKRILCPMDFSPSAMQAFGFALDLARQADGRVTLLHAVEWPAEEPRASAHFNVPEYRRHVAADAEEQLQSLVTDESRAWVDIDKAVVFGRAHREILRAAEANPPDLIVMGAQGRGGIGLALFGSTTQEVVRGAKCPVLTVRGPHQI